MTVAGRRRVSRTAREPDPPDTISTVIFWDARDAAPPLRKRQLNKIAREAAKAEEAARIAAEAAKLRAMVFKSLKPLQGRLWSVHGDALMMIGPHGGIAISASAVSLLEPLAAGGRHVLDERDRAALDALAPRFAVVGLRVDVTAKGVRIAKARAAT